MYKPATSRFMTEKLGLKIEEFTPSSTVEPIEISDVKPIASYTWLDSSEPTIVVPGEHSFCGLEEILIPDAADR